MISADRAVQRRASFAAPLAVALATMVGAAPSLAATTEDDRFIAGYASAILEREFELPAVTVSVEGGTIIITSDAIEERTFLRLDEALRSIPGVTAVTVRRDPVAPAPDTVTRQAAPAATRPDTPTVDAATTEGAVTVQTDGAADAADGPQILPRSVLFDPLLADPRWPHFSASYRYFRDDPDVEHAGAVGFGDTFSLYRDQAFGGRWEVGFQAGVFALFDLDSESKDLLNADYWVGIPLSFRKGDFSATTRIYHQSSHLGDEFLLRGTTDQTDRVNLSYEAVDLLLSYDIDETLRVYGGGGYLFHREPEDLDPWVAQTGVEYVHDRSWAGVMRPVAALDVQVREESGWSPDFAGRAGVQIENPRLISETVQITAEYYNGRNPNGQFYDRDLEYIGLGIHVFLNE